MGSFDAEEERKYLGIIAPIKSRGRNSRFPGKPVNSVRAGLPEDWTRATFIVREAYLEKLKDYAYTERISIKRALDIALEMFLQDVDDLLSRDKEEVMNSGVLNADGERIYNVREVSAIMNRSPLSIYSYIHQKRLKAKKVGNVFYVTESDLKDFAKNYAIVNEVSE